MTEDQTRGDAAEDRGCRGRAADALPPVALCVGFFMVMMDVTVVNVALPNRGRELHGDVSGLQWVVDGYTVVFASLLLTAGGLGDLLGHRRAFQVGLALFVLSSAGCGLAPAMGVLISLRLLQGLSAVLVVPTSLALIIPGMQVAVLIGGRHSSPALWSPGCSSTVPRPPRRRPTAARTTPSRRARRCARSEEGGPWPLSSG